MVGISVLTSFIALLVASHASAQSPIDPSQIPSTCQSTCNSVSSQVSTCGADITCLCTDTIVSGFTSCLDCAVSAGMTTSSAQSVLDQFSSGCSAAGHPVSSGTISGSSSGSSSSSSAATSPSAGSTTPSAGSTSPASGTSTGSTGTPTGSTSAPTGTTSSKSSGAMPNVASAGALALAAISASLLFA